jgi:hypothetical protein
MDLGMGQGGEHDLYLVRKYGEFVPMYVHTGRSDMSQGFNSAKLGARGIILKWSHNPPLSESLKSVYRDVMCGAVNPLHFSHSCPARLIDATEALCRHLPRNVAEWESRLDFRRQYLWDIWDVQYGADPKAVVKWYRILCGAFSSFFAQGEPLPWRRVILSAEEMAAIEDTFWLNRRVIEKLAFSRDHMRALRKERPG